MISQLWHPEVAFAFDIKQVCFKFSSAISRDQQAAVGSLLRIEAFLSNNSLLRKNDLHLVRLDRYLGTSIRESAKIAHIIEQLNT